jgi:sigma-B regulation protein RsbU (phosphoserine phosphatase)
LYLLHAGDVAEVLAVSGWSQEWVHQRLNLDFTTLNVESSLEPVVFFHRPPGIPYNAPDMQASILRAGLYVPLTAQRYPVGFMVVHSTQKNRFEPGQVALLQTFANHAALAMQRAGLIHQLRAKITQLEAAQAELAKKERFERELELARQVQQSVLPRTFPQIPGFHFAARNEPARAVGGDFYDVITLDEEHFGVAIADVSDKGMAAALYMALTRSLLRAEARRERSPRLLVENVNQLLLALGEPNMFVTVFYGVIEKHTRQMTYIRSGHDRPLLAHEGAVLELGGRGVALGLFDPDRFRVSEEQIVLTPGDHLLLYTDGLTDIQAPDGSFFGKEALKRLLQSQTVHSPDQLCEQIFAQLHAFQDTAEQYDDMTMLLIAID